VQKVEEVTPEVCSDQRARQVYTYKSVVGRKGGERSIELRSETGGKALKVA
jgi:hypothetical protein